MTDKVELSRDQLEDLTADVTKNVLSRMGFDVDDPKEMRKDMAHLRRWRVSVDKVGHVGIVSAVGVFVSGVLAALWVGINAMMGRA